MTLIAIALAIGFVLRAPKPSQPLQAVRLNAEMGVDASLDTSLGTSALLSPDGKRLALVATGADQKRRIYVARLTRCRPPRFPGRRMPAILSFHPMASGSAFSATAAEEDFHARRRAGLRSGDAPNDRGGSWGEDGTIVFTPDVQLPLSKVSSWEELPNR